MALAPMPDFGGTKPVQLCVKLPPVNRGLHAESLSDAMRALYREGVFTDVTLICAGQEFRAHRAVLAARSEVFKHGLAANDTSNSNAEGARLEVRLADIANLEAVKSMLDYLYEQDMDANAPAHRNMNIIKDVLRLASNFNLPGLKEHATHWLSKDVSTHNVVEKLGICEEFGCSVLRERILEQLTINKKALSDVVNAEAITQHPALMQALLQHAAAVPEEPQPKKKGRKCST